MIHLTIPTEAELELIHKWLTPETLDTATGDDLFDGRKPWCLVLISTDSQPVGFFSVYNMDHLNRKCEVGTVIGEPAGRQIAWIAFKRLMKLLFNDYGMNRIYMKPLARNTKAIAAAQKMGFTIEGTERQSVYNNGRYEDLVIMSLLKDEYKRR